MLTALILLTIALFLLACLFFAASYGCWRMEQLCKRILNKPRKGGD